MATAVGLTILPVFIFFHSASVHTVLENAQHEMIAIMSRGQIQGKLDRAVIEASRVDFQAVGGRLQDAIEHSQTEFTGPPAAIDLDGHDPIDLDGHDYQLVLAREFPRKLRASPATGSPGACQDMKLFGATLVSYDCLAILSNHPHLRPPDYLGIFEEDRSNLLNPIISLLQELELGSPGWPPGNSGDLPRFLFAHIAIETPDAAILLVYPATYLGQEYDFTRRPWYQRSTRIGELSISPLYRDYPTRVSTITISKSLVSPSGTKVHVGVDTRISTPPASFGIYFLNGLLALGAALFYLRYYTISRRSYIKHLFRGTLLLFLSYLTITLNELFFLRNMSSIPTATLIKYCLPFIPSASFIILAANRLRPYMQRSWKREFCFWASIEVICAFVNLGTDTSIASALFACFAICLFGFRLLGSRKRYRDPALDNLVPHPVSLSYYGFLTYVFWGLSQLTLVILSHDISAIRGVLAHTAVFQHYRELLAGETSVFIILLYAKALVVFVTILYMGSTQLATISQEFVARNKAPFVQLDRDGRVVGQIHFPAEFANLQGVKFSDLFKHDSDRREFESAMDRRVRLSSFLCRLRGDFHNHLVRLGMEHAEDEDVSNVTFRLVDDNELMRRLDSSLSVEIREFLHTLDKVLCDLELPSHLKDMLKLKQSMIVTKLDSEMRVLADNMEFPLRLSVKDAYMMLDSKLRALTERARGIEVKTKSLPPGTPRKIQFSKSAIDLVLECLTLDLQKDIFEMASRPLRARLRVALSEEDAHHGGDGFASMIIDFDRQIPLLQRIRLANARQSLGMSRGESVSGDTQNISLAIYLLRIFNARLYVTDSGAEPNITIRFQFLRSSRQTI